MILSSQKRLSQVSLNFRQASGAINEQISKKKTFKGSEGSGNKIMVKNNQRTSGVVTKTSEKSQSVMKKEETPKPLNRIQLIEKKREFNLLVKKNDCDGIIALYDQVKKTFERVDYERMINAMAKGGRSTKAFSLYQKMKKHGFLPRENVFLQLLLACANSVDEGWHVQKSLYVLEQMGQYNMTPNLYFYNTILQTCAKQKDIAASKIIFQLMKKTILPDISTFTVVMSAYVNHEDLEMPLFYWSEIKRMGLKPDIKAYNLLFKVIGRSGDPMKAIEIFETDMKESKIPPDAFTYDLLLGACMKRKLKEDYEIAEKLVKRLFKEEVVMDTMLCNSVLRLYQIDVNKTEKFILKMAELNIKPDRVTFEILANYYGIHGNEVKTNMIVNYAIETMPKKIELKLLLSFVRLCEKKKNTSYITPLFGHLQKLKLAITPEFFASLKNLAKVGGQMADPHVNTLMSNLASLPPFQKKHINEELDDIVSKMKTLPAQNLILIPMIDKSTLPDMRVVPRGKTIPALPTAEVGSVPVARNLPQPKRVKKYGLFVKEDKPKREFSYHDLTADMEGSENYQIEYTKTQPTTTKPTQPQTPIQIPTTICSIPIPTTTTATTQSDLPLQIPLKPFQSKYVFNPKTNYYERRVMVERRENEERERENMPKSVENISDTDDRYSPNRLELNKKEVPQEIPISTETSTRYNIDSKFAQKSKKFSGLTLDIASIFEKFEKNTQAREEERLREEQESYKSSSKSSKKASKKSSKNINYE
jgi:pentatricopeptide repeat protein